jgi:hypothetical protein
VRVVWLSGCQDAIVQLGLQGQGPTHYRYWTHALFENYYAQVQEWFPGRWTSIVAKESSSSGIELNTNNPKFQYSNYSYTQ